MSIGKNNTELFYREIMQRVCESVKEDFLNEGVGEDVIGELKRLWTEKLVQSGIFQPKATPNFYIKYNAYDTTTGLQRYAPTYGGVKTGIMMPNPGGYNPLVHSHFKSDPNKTTFDNVNLYLQKKENAYGSALVSTVGSSSNGGKSHALIKPKFTTIPAKQEDNKGSGIENLPVNEDESDVDSDLEVFEKVEVKKNISENKEDEEEDELSSVTSDSEEYIESEAKDFLLAQYEKVHRVRNKWKCVFHDAVLHINGKEYVFERVVGELERDW